MSKTYTKGFKRDSVNHLIVNGKTIREVADPLGISDSAKDEELKILRQENKDLKMECEILKKAMGIFSRTQK